MDEGVCIGCRTSFQDKEDLPLDRRLAEYFDYHLPLRQDRARWALLRSIVSFLNGQGGAVYLGIHPTKGTVSGQKLSRKEQDSFKLFMKQLLEKVHPKVDLNHRQEVVVQYVPVLIQKEFVGKYITKIVVQQGDPSRVYYFGEKIKLEGQNGKVDEIEVFYGYQRDEHGETVQIKGTNLLLAIHEKGTTPNKQSHLSHEGCHPQPPHLQFQIRKIHFSNTSLDDFILLQAAVEKYLNSLDIVISYIEAEGISCMDVEDEEEFKVLMAFLQENLNEWNREAFKDRQIFFEMRGEKDHYVLIENNPKAKKQQREERPYQKRQEERGKDNERRPFFNKPMRQAQRPQRMTPPMPPPSTGPPSHFPKKYSLTFTPINCHTSKQLQNFLLHSIYTKMEKYSILYKNTIEIFLGSEKDFHKYTNAVMKNQEAIGSFAKRTTMCLGRNLALLRIRNYNKFRIDQMIQVLQAMMQDDLKQSALVKEGQNFSIMLKMKNQQAACIWLDSLIESRCLLQFSNPNKMNGAKRILVQLELE